MKISLKLAVSVGIAFLINLIGYIAYKYYTREKDQYIHLLHNTEVRVSVNSVLHLKSEFLLNTSKDYSCFDWMCGFVKAPDLVEAKSTISPVTILEVNALQIYNDQYKPVYVDFMNPINDTVDIPEEALLALKQRRSINFFYDSPYGLMNIVGSTIHPSADLDRKTPPQGYFLLFKVYDSTFLQSVGDIIGCKLTLVKSDQALIKSDIADSSFVPLKSYNNGLIGYLQIEKNNKYLQRIQALNTFFKYFFIATSVLILIVLLFTLHFIVVRPLAKIVYAINSNSPEKLLPIALKMNEFGKISRMIMAFYDQNNSLQVKVEELNQAQTDLMSLNNELKFQKEELESTAEQLLLATEEITNQKAELESQHDEINESIKYASIIQAAVIEVPDSFYAIFPDSFFILKPRNVLSGDFYWIHENSGRFFIVAADCTGHSLAGALLSMLGISYLNEIVTTFPNITAADILNKLRDKLVKSLHQTGAFGEAHGGMDAVIVIIEPGNKTMQYSGAFNPVYVVSQDNESQEPVLTEYKGDRMPVGIYLRQEPFTNHSIDLKNNDAIYVFSDGMIDQFGGPDGRKFRSQSFKNMFVDIYNHSMSKQKYLIEKQFDIWKGAYPQTDDVLIIGIRIQQ